MKPILISIEANIGAGKSTVLHKLQSTLNSSNTICIQEPIHYWENFRDPKTNRSLLELYYINPKKYAFPLQTMIYNSLEQILYQAIETENNTSSCIISERSLQSSRDIFAKMLYDSDIMSPIEYQVYNDCIANNPIPLDICIYLKTTPEICYERMRHRNRQGEQKITLDYLKKCHNAHEEWITNMGAQSNTKLYIIDVDIKTPNEIVSEVLNILTKIYPKN